MKLHHAMLARAVYVAELRLAIYRRIMGRLGRRGYIGGEVYDLQI